MSIAVTLHGTRRSARRLSCASCSDGSSKPSVEYSLAARVIAARPSAARYRLRRRQRGALSQFHLVLFAAMMNGHGERFFTKRLLCVAIRLDASQASCLGAR